MISGYDRGRIIESQGEALNGLRDVLDWQDSDIILLLNLPSRMMYVQVLRSEQSDKQFDFI